MPRRRVPRPEGSGVPRPDGKGRDKAVMGAPLSSKYDSIPNIVRENRYNSVTYRIAAKSILHGTILCRSGPPKRNFGSPGRSPTGAGTRSVHHMGEGGLKWRPRPELNR